MYHPPLPLLTISAIYLRISLLPRMAQKKKNNLIHPLKFSAKKLRISMIIQWSKGFSCELDMPCNGLALKITSTELGTLEQDTFNSGCLILISNVDTFNFLLSTLFWIQFRKIENRFFKDRESLPFLYINPKWRAKFQVSLLLIRDSDWLNFIHFSGYKFKLGQSRD